MKTTIRVHSPRRLTVKRSSPFRMEVEIIEENGTVQEFAIVSSTPLRVNSIRRYGAQPQPPEKS